jgi:hypothetical protein
MSTSLTPPTFERRSLEARRAFIPLAVSGCGIGCKYCYIDHPTGAPVALPVSTMRQVLHKLGATLGPSPGAASTLIAMSYDTEVSVSDSMIRNARMCLEFARAHHLPVQFSTKFPLPKVLREILEDWPPEDPHPVVFTTITTISLSSRLEPRAPSPQERAVNFGPHSGAWLSYALIKPFLATTANDADRLIGLLNQHRPDGVVVGIRYRREATMDGTGSAHPVADGWTAAPPSPAARAFIGRLSALDFRVFMSTRCVTAWHNSSMHGQFIKENHPHLCVNCGVCR